MVMLVPVVVVVIMPVIMPVTVVMVMPVVTFRGQLEPAHPGAERVAQCAIGHV